MVPLYLALHFQLTCGARIQALLHIAHGSRKSRSRLVSLASPSTRIYAICIRPFHTHPDAYIPPRLLGSYLSLGRYIDFVLLASLFPSSVYLTTFFDHADKSAAGFTVDPPLEVPTPAARSAH